MSTISASTTTTTGFVVTSNTTGTLVFQTGATPTTAMTIDSSQNVCMGTTTPSAGAILTVSGGVSIANMSTGLGVSTGSAGLEVGASRTGDGACYIDLHSTAGSDYESRLLRTGGANGSTDLTHKGTGNLNFITENAAPIVFATAGVDRGRMDSAGIFVWGATSSGSNTGLLHVSGSISATALVGRQGVAGTSNGSSFNTWWSGSALQAWVDSTNIGNFSISSDYRVKKYIKTQSAQALDRVMQLRPVTYEFADYGVIFKADGVAREGFIAHELQAIIPSAVEGEKDAENQIQSLKLDALCSVLTKAIQELKAELDAAKADIATLKGA
jgi:hypothetical protein